MSKGHSLLKAFTTISVALTLGVSMNADAGLFGFGGDSWKEEVLLHDGQKIIVKRSQTYGGRREIGQTPPIKEQDITFTLPGSNKTFTFKSEYSEDIGGINFHLLALHILNGTPYLVVEPVGCLASNKWGRPSPPYVFFKHDGKEWQRIQLAEFPTEFKEINLVVSTKNEERIFKARSAITAEIIRKLNGELKQPEYKTILREAYPAAAGGCGEMVYGGKDDGGTGGWHGIGLFGDTYAACLNYCWQHKISKRYCPCETLFKGKK